MNMSTRATRLGAVGAIGVGAVLLARAYRARRAFDFGDAAVVITGGSRGLGLELARELAGLGARLSLVARDEAELRRAVENVKAHAPYATVMTTAADVRNRDDAARAVADAVNQMGRVDVLINNAGIIQVGPLDHMRLADYEDAMATHFWGPLYMVLAALPHMERQGGGRIVNISSIGGKIAVPHLVPYSASKFALTGLSDGLRVELLRRGIVVTTVCPGLMRTGSPVNALFKGRRPQEYAWFAISDSLPLATIDAGRAARQIIAACGRGDAELIVGIQARLAVKARTLAPELFQDGMAIMNELLPSATSREGDVARTGRESTSRWAPSVLTAPTDAAAKRNNEL
jgi:short-subunit dehydrogenase